MTCAMSDKTRYLVVQVPCLITGGYLQKKDNFLNQPPISPEMVVCMKYHPELEDSIKIQAVCMIVSILSVKIG